MRTDSIELVEDLLFQHQILRHGLDHQIDILEVFEVRRGADQQHFFFQLFGRHLALLYARLVDPPHRRNPLPGQIVLSIRHHHRQAGIAHHFRNLCAHGARPYDTDFIDVHGVTTRFGWIPSSFLRLTHD